MRQFILLLALFAACLLTCSGCCTASEVTTAQWDSLDTAELERAARASGADLELEEGFTLQKGLSQLGELLPRSLEEALASACRTGLVLLLAVLFSELTGVVGDLAGAGQRFSTIVGALTVTAVSAADVNALMGLGRRAVDEIWTFSTLLIPVMTALSAACGSFTGATGRQVATFLFADTLVTLMDKVLLPMVYLYTAACVAASVTDNLGLEEVAKAVKALVTTVLSALLLAFTGYLSLTSAAAAGVDAVTARLTRSLISAMVPVVGGILANATDTVLSGVGVLKGVVGTFGVVAVLGLGMSAFVQLGVQYLMYRMVSVLSQVLSGSRVARLVGNIASAFALVLGMTAASALLVLISIFATLSVAVG
jgi:stage III sporulation protein AE